MRYAEFVQLEPAERRQQIADELKAIRGAKGTLKVGKFAQYPALATVCGEDDLLDGFLMFRRELQRWATGSREEAAYAWAVLADAETVLDRFQIAADKIPQAAGADQRTIRTWSDKAIPEIAAELDVIATSQGRLGRDLISIEITDSDDDGLMIVIDQMTKTELPSLPVEVSLWRENPDGDTYELDIDLGQHDYTEVTREEYMMRRHRLQITKTTLGDTSLSVTVVSAVGPSPTFQAQLACHEVSAQVAVMRGALSVELMKNSQS